MLKDTKLIRGTAWPASFLLSLIDLRVIGALKGGKEYLLFRAGYLDTGMLLTRQNHQGLLGLQPWLFF